MDDKPSSKQLEFLKTLGYRGKPPFTMKKASEAINKLVTINRANDLREKVNYDLTEEVIGVTDDNIGLYSYILTRCVEAEIYEPALIGMLFNNIKLDIRQKNK